MSEKIILTDDQRDAIAHLAGRCSSCGGATKGKQVCLACAAEQEEALHEQIERLTRENEELWKERDEAYERAYKACKEMMTDPDGHDSMWNEGYMVACGDCAYAIRALAKQGAKDD